MNAHSTDIEQRLADALRDLAATTTVSPDAWDKITSRRRRRPPVWRVATAVAAAAAAAVITVAVLTRTDKGAVQAAAAKTAAGSATYYEPQRLPSGYVPDNTPDLMRGTTGVCERWRGTSPKAVCDQVASLTNASYHLPNDQEKRIDVSTVAGSNRLIGGVRLAAEPIVRVRGHAARFESTEDHHSLTWIEHGALISVASRGGAVDDAELARVAASTRAVKQRVAGLPLVIGQLPQEENFSRGTSLKPFLATGRTTGEPCVLIFPTFLCSPLSYQGPIGYIASYGNSERTPAFLVGTVAREVVRVRIEVSGASPVTVDPIGDDAGFPYRFFVAPPIRGMPTAILALGPGDHELARLAVTGYSANGN